MMLFRVRHQDRYLLNALLLGSAWSELPLSRCSHGIAALDGYETHGQQGALVFGRCWGGPSISCPMSFGLFTREASSLRTITQKASQGTMASNRFAQAGLAPACQLLLFAQLLFAQTALKKPTDWDRDSLRIADRFAHCGWDM